MSPQAWSRALAADESGNDLIEYSLIAALIALAAVATLQHFSGNITAAFSSEGSTLTSAT